jgi:hypothetical protein
MEPVALSEVYAPTAGAGFQIFNAKDGLGEVMRTRCVPLIASGDRGICCGTMDFKPMKNNGTYDLTCIYPFDAYSAKADEEALNAVLGARLKDEHAGVITQPLTSKMTYLLFVLGDAATDAESAAQTHDKSHAHQHPQAHAETMLRNDPAEARPALGPIAFGPI